MTPEQFLAALYTDENLRARFLAEPGETARSAGFTGQAVPELEKIDREALILAARSFTRKRALAQNVRPRPSRLLAFLRGL
jgi:hypothetical protein